MNQILVFVLRISFYSLAALIVIFSAPTLNYEMHNKLKKNKAQGKLFALLT